VGHYRWRTPAAEQAVVRKKSSLPLNYWAITICEVLDIVNFLALSDKADPENYLNL